MSEHTKEPVLLAYTARIVELEQQRDELLAALKELERVYETGDFDTEFKPALTNARAIIAKVEREMK